MGGTFRGRWLPALAAVALVAIVAAPASAQTGQIKGKVVDAQNKPVDGATVTIAQADGASNQKWTLKTKKGEYMQIGITPGQYKVTAEKDGLSQTFNTRIGLDLVEVNFTLRPGGGGGDVSKEAAAKAAALQTKFKEGATLADEGKYDEAITKFTEVLTDVPKCGECYSNIGQVYSLKKEYDKAEEAYKKALEISPNSADAYNGLATVYNAQKKFKEAQEMSAEATKRMAAVPGGGGGSATALYNQGVISWNANDFAKAQEHFSAAIAADPKHGESHFMLGRVYLNLGKLGEAAKEFETYGKVTPNGPNAKEAASNFEMLKQYIK
jgi:tetratricopeptide (TPR) repeat protein